VICQLRLEILKKLVEEGFYNEILFHRIMNGFMIQAGDPLTKDSTKKNFGEQVVQIIFKTNLLMLVEIEIVEEQFPWQTQAQTLVQASSS